MVEYSFIRTTAKFGADGDVKFAMPETEERESILIAKDWEMGEALSEHSTETGFVGKGYTKRGIYVSFLIRCDLWDIYKQGFNVQQARFRGREYVLTQPMDVTLRESEVEAVLRAEYRLLCQCDGFKQQFDAHAKKLGVHTIPGEETAIWWSLCYIYA